jgi:AcrR family transcriptional regulator
LAQRQFNPRYDRTRECEVKKPTVDQRRAEILDGAIQVLIERGFANTRVADVAKRLDVSPSLIHYHFDSKESLLAEAFAQAANEDIALLEADIDAAPTAVRKLDALIRNYVPEGSNDVEWMLWIDAWGEALRNPQLRTISQRLDAESLDLIERVLHTGVETGEFTCDDVPGAAMRLAGLIDGLAVQFAAHDGVLGAEQIVEHVRIAAAREVGLDVAAFRDSGAATNGGKRAEALNQARSARQAALRARVERYHDALARGDHERAATALVALLDATP